MSRPGAQAPIVVVGAGIAGLACALRLAAAGQPVQVLERHSWPGGKIRTVDSPAGPIDAGPTVLTMKPVFEELFAQAGARLDEHVALRPLDVLARHWWPDSGPLDLHADRARSEAAVRAFAGARATREFRDFCQRAETLFSAFDAPMIQSAEPSVAALTRHVMARPKLMRIMAPNATLADMLGRQFTDKRLAQLFGRYATYVGGTPERVPAILALIWRAEEAGVWTVDGGMAALARAVATCAEDRGASIRYDAHVDRIEAPGGKVQAVVLADGARIPASAVVFNGDPRALANGRLGGDMGHVAAEAAQAERSLSAHVWTFAAKAEGLPLAHHNVFFCADPREEFGALRQGRVPREATLYVCAEDRRAGATPPEVERFEIIRNAPPLAGGAPGEETPCDTPIFERLARFGLSFDPVPEAAAVTGPAAFEALFPASAGSLYGQSPHGLMAAFQRPTARTAVAGLYLAGGGTHPGAGVPMATISARHAAAAILSDRASPSPSHPTAMRGGMSTG